MDDINTYNICFLGQTGFGKSSLINALFHTSFNTDPLISCTKELYSVTTLIKDVNGERLVTVYDTPGIGEFSTNSHYQAYYNLAVSLADHIVLVTTLDRTDSTSQDLLESLVPYLKNDKVKFTIALNRIDSTGIAGDSTYEPWNKETNSPSQACLKRIDARKTTLQCNFGNGEYGINFLPFEVIPVCAVRSYGLETLKQRIIK